MRTLASSIVPIVFIILFTAHSGCSTDEVTQQLSAEERYGLAMSYFNDEDYLSAIEELKIVTIQFGGTQWADDAQYHLAESRYLRGEFVLAAYEYDVLIRTMSTSEFVRLARYRKASCYFNLSPGPNLDQEYTKKAIEEFQLFLEYHPTDSLAVRAEDRIAELNGKLAQKDFESGVIYYKMGYNKAATYYFDLVLEKYHDTPFAEPATYHKAEALMKRRKFSEAEGVLSRFLEKYPGSAMFGDAKKLLESARESSGNGSPS